MDRHFGTSTICCVLQLVDWVDYRPRLAGSDSKCSVLRRPTNTRSGSVELPELCNPTVARNSDILGYPARRLLDQHRRYQGHAPRRKRHPGLPRFDVFRSPDSTSGSLPSQHRGLCFHFFQEQLGLE